MVSATFIIDVGSVLLPWGGGGGGYYYNNNLKCMLILSYIDDSGSWQNDIQFKMNIWFCILLICIHRIIKY